MPLIFRRLFAAALFVAVASPVLAQGAPPAPPVSVAKPVTREVVDWIEFPGRFEAAAFVQVRAQVSGALQSINFIDGQQVKEGDLLFKIDAREFEATLRQAEAAVTGNQTRLDLAATELKRAENLRQSGNIPEQTFQQRQQTYLEAQANLRASQAAVETAQINLGYTEIRAPISGRIGRKLVTEGNLISSGTSGTLLTTIVSFSPVHFYFDVDERSFLTYTRARSSQAISADGGQRVFVALADESDFTREGTLDFLANQVDPETGTIRVRASIPNTDQFITPGLFGRVKLAARPAYTALILPDEAILLDQTRHLVMTVAPDGTVTPKTIETGPKIGQFRVVASGLGPDDTVIVNGLMRARPGSKVTPQPTELKVPDDLTRPSVIAAN